MCMIYFHTKFYMPSSSDTSVITIKVKAKYIFHTATIFFYILQEITSTEVAYFSNICYHTSFQDLTLSSGSVTLTSQLHVSGMLVC
jgi:hypothetical protein